MIGHDQGKFEITGTTIEGSTISAEHFKQQIKDVYLGKSNLIDIPENRKIPEAFQDYGGEGISKLGGEFHLLDPLRYGPTSGTIQFRINPTNAKDKDGNALPFSVIKAAIERAVSSWNIVAHSYVTLSVYSSSVSNSRGYDNGVSTITFEPDNPLLQGSTGAAWVLYTNGMIDEIDIIFNSDMRWNTNSSYPGSYPLYQHPSRGQIGPVDLEDIAAHEIGHGVGLHHVGDDFSTYTLYPTNYVAQSWWEKTWRRSLENGDKAGKVYQDPSFLSSITQQIPKILLCAPSSATISGNYVIPANYFVSVESGKTVTVTGTVSPDIRLEQSGVLRGLYAGISDALSSATSGQTARVSSSQTLTGNLTVPSGVTLTISSGVNINLNTRSIICEGTGKIVNNGTVSNSVCYATAGSDYKGYYPNIATGLSNASSGQTVHVSWSSTLSSDQVVPSGVTLSLESGTTTTLNSRKITTSSGTITLNGGSVSPNIQRKTSAYVLKGLHPTIAGAITDAATNERVMLGAGTYTENVSMKSNVVLMPNQSTPTINGDVTFNSVSSGSLLGITVNGEINILGGSANWVYDLTAKDVIDIDNGSGHEVWDVTLTDNGYVDTYNNAPYLDNITATNTKYYGVTGYGSDASLTWGIYENKTRAIHCMTNSDFVMEDIEFCGQDAESEYDIYVNPYCSVDILMTGYGTFSECPAPVYGNVTITGTCAPCGGLAKSIAANGGVTVTATEGVDPAHLAYKEAKRAYMAVQKKLSEARHKDRSAAASQYAGEYEQVINQVRKVIDDYPESEAAGKALRLVAYAYRALEQHDKIMPVAEEIKRTYPGLTAVALHVEIPFYLENNEIDKALQAIDQMLALDAKADVEETQALLYRKATIYLRYAKDNNGAAAIFNELINLDPQSGPAQSAIERLNKMGDGYKPAPQTDSEEEQLEFSVVNYPNPANPGTTIKYTLPEEGRVVVAIFNVIGRRVIEVENSFMTKGSHVVYWDGRDQSGSPSATGLYFYRIQYENKVLTNKFLLVK